jgi:hypothetical protein
LVAIERRIRKRLAAPGFDDVDGVGADYAEDFVFFGHIPDLDVFHDDELVENGGKLCGGNALHQKPDFLFSDQDDHLRDELPLSVEVARVATLPGRQFLDFIRHHALQPGLALRTAKLEEAHTVQSNDDSMISGSVVMFE